MSKKSKTLTPEEETADFIQKLLRLSRGGSTFYEKTLADGSTTMVFQTPAEAISFDVHKLFPSLTKTGYTSPSPNYCNQYCKDSHLDFIGTGFLLPTLTCSLENTPRPRLGDGFLEHPCVWNRVYRLMVTKPEDINDAQSLFGTLLSTAPVLELPAGPETYFPTLDRSQQ